MPNAIKNLFANAASILSINEETNNGSCGIFDKIILFITPTNKNGMPMKIHDTPIFLIPFKIPADNKTTRTAVSIVKIKTYFKFFCKKL